VFTVDASGQLTPVTQTTAANADTGAGPASVAFSPSGGLLATANANANTVSVFTVDASGQLTPVTQTTAANANTGSTPLSVAFSPSGGLLATANANASTVSVFTVDGSGQLTPVTQATAGNANTGPYPDAVAFSSTGGLLATANQNSNTVSLGRRWIFLHDEIEAGVRRAPRQAQARSAPQPPAAQHLRPTGKRSKWYPEVVPDPDSAHQPRLVG
jgi:6-phosphogluconolactonase (cycloisomerase 2 family)